MSTFHAYAATTPNSALQPFTFDPGELRPEEVEIKVSYCGICHSDVSMLDNEWGMSKFPFVPGHEAVGTVTERHDGKLVVKLGPELEFLEPPAGKDVDAQMVVDLRRMLREAGYEPA